MDTYGTIWIATLDSRQYLFTLKNLCVDSFCYHQMASGSLTGCRESSIQQLNQSVAQGKPKQVDAHPQTYVPIGLVKFDQVLFCIIG